MLERNYCRASIRLPSKLARARRLHERIMTMHPLLTKLESAARPARPDRSPSSRSWRREIRDVLCNLLDEPHGPFRVEPGRRRAVPGPAQRVRLPHRPPDLGHRPPDLSAQARSPAAIREFSTIRTKGGLMGYPNPHESEYDLFMTGHAGCSVGHALRPGERRRAARPRRLAASVAVIGDGAFPAASCSRR